MFVDRVFDNPVDYNSVQLVIGAIFFAIQIYCDFSGYSDMAIGAAKTMGFDLMTNFNRPYFTTNIKLFWDRWHISLSSWFRDYVYIPLGGNRVSETRMLFNFAIVFLLSGFWHGANWTFIIWGALHAFYVLTNMLIKKKWNWFNFNTYKLYKPIAWFVTFILVCFAWIFFRADSLTNAFDYISSLFNNTHNSINIKILPNGFLNGFGNMSYMISIFSILLLIFIERNMPPRLDQKSFFFIDIIFVSVVSSLVLIFGVFQESSFIYFQF